MNERKSEGPKQTDKSVLPLGFQPFEAVVRYPRNRSAAIHRAVLRALRDLFILLTVIVFLWAPTARMIRVRNEGIASAAAAREMSKWPRGHIEKEYRNAVQYNERIADSGQHKLGEAIDPFIDDPDEDTISKRDNDYQSMLKTTNGVMGTVKIPRISLKLPFYHGTSKAILQVGIGHLYGTSLPVGGKSTNSVLTGHRGLVDAELFTRLDELKKGDIIYIETLDRMMGYRVSDINIVNPTDVHLYKVVPGQDLLTLMTCTPYGINTQRLVITAKRSSIPKGGTYYHDDQDAVLPAGITGVTVLLVGLLWAMHRNYRLLVPPAWHYDGSPVAWWSMFARRTDARGHFGKRRCKTYV
ncbi:class C sortase [Bifidobacterium sp. ESL0690]|uniref:class C sortase n=1 Tax=Bifidobacterium sp. ESL0690 TaxID=2983214 RepID=UPI0023F9409F|nr:class C sortase [Bifidobacterium sp. ESL0690]WEV47467.1 class C sortase [Bifidobacterium sp. ESL0690]